jgi:hypothetical protein
MHLPDRHQRAPKPQNGRGARREPALLPPAAEEKARLVSGYSGYIASGEEITAGEADYSEIFTITKDVSPDDARVRAQWPCHGPTPWPDDDCRWAVLAFMEQLGVMGEKVLKLIALGIGTGRHALIHTPYARWLASHAGAALSRGVGQISARHRSAHRLRAPRDCRRTMWVGSTSSCVFQGIVAGHFRRT